MIDILMIISAIILAAILLFTRTGRFVLLTILMQISPTFARAVRNAMIAWRVTF